jgi:hypothetical protein
MPGSAEVARAASGDTAATPSAVWRKLGEHSHFVYRHRDDISVDKSNCLTNMLYKICLSAMFSSTAPGAAAVRSGIVSGLALFSVRYEHRERSA